MLSDLGFVQYCDTKHLTEKVRESIQQIRTSEPTRRLTGRGGRSPTLYASLKMGRSIQGENNLGLAFRLFWNCRGHH